MLITLIRNKQAWFSQIGRFAIVGCIATLVHISIVLLLVEKQHFQPLIANLFAYACAFQVSYFGHRYWTFSNHGERRDTLYRFMLVAFSGISLNETLYYIFINQLHIYYSMALALVLMIVPAFTFTFNKFWVFKSGETICAD